MRFDILNRLGVDQKCDGQTDRQTDGRTNRTALAISWSNEAESRRANLQEKKDERL